MLAINHALTGAVIGLSIGNPVLAIPAAFVSHFALDAVPHYDPPGTEHTRISTARFTKQLTTDASVCLILVIILCFAKPTDWLLASACAFVATSPDFFWLPKYIAAQKNKVLTNTNWFLRFHSFVQWRTGPRLWWVEAMWFTTATLMLMSITA